jgi:cytochrome c oxidase subunit 2
MTMSSSNCKRWIQGTAFAFGGMLLSMTAAANPRPWQLNLDAGVTPLSNHIWQLHMAAFWVCVGLGVIVFVMNGLMTLLERRLVPWQESSRRR